MQPRRISSRDNPLLQSLRKLARDNGGYREAGQVWLEGDHLLRAFVQRGGRALQVLLGDSGWQRPDLRALAAQAAQPAAITVLADELFKGLSALPSPPAIGALVALPDAAAPRADLPSLVLDRVQDAGNVGSMLRSAAALGVRQVLAMQGTAALWQPKVLRAAMGAHFALQLHEGLQPAALAALVDQGLALVATSSHTGEWLHHAALPGSCAWVFGHEGQGVAPELMALCRATVRIAQPGGEESLNVAAAAAVCLYEWSRQQLPAADR